MKEFLLSDAGQAAFTLISIAWAAAMIIVAVAFVKWLGGGK